MSAWELFEYITIEIKKEVSSFKFNIQLSIYLLQRQISVYIKKNIQRAYTDGTKQLVVKSKNNSELFSKSISKYVKDLLKEQNKTELLEVE